MTAEPLSTEATAQPSAEALDEKVQGVNTPRLHWWFEVVLVLAFYGIYTLVRNTFGSNGQARHGVQVNPLAVQHAFGHAKDVIGAERALGLFVEPHIQHWYLSLPAHGVIRFWNVYYASLHFVVTVVVLIWLFRKAPARYPFFRNSLAACTGLALIGFAGYVLMPPRLLDFTGPYGACNPAYHLHAAQCAPGHSYHLIDTLVRYGGLWSFGSGAVADVSNQYAAMPSLHIGWSTWCALALYPLMKRRWAKVLVVAYPFATLFCITVTANHYWLDAVGGLVVLSAGFAVGWLITRLTDALFLRWRRRGPAPADAATRAAPTARSAPG